MTRFATEVVPSPAAISRLTDEIAEFLQRAAVDERATHHMSLVIEEILTNVATHGANPDSPATVVIEVAPDKIAGEICDRGRPFDLRTAPAPDLSTSVEDRQIGGLGLHLVRKFTSSLDYRSDGQQNWTSFSIAREISR